jgi:hypothetical protein
MSATEVAGPGSSPRPAVALSPDRGLIRLWIGVLLPPASWVADLLARYLMIRYANSHDLRWPLHVPTVVCLTLLLVGAWLCWRERRQALSQSQKPRATLAAWGLALAAYFLLLILTQAYPAFALSVREIT